MKAGDSFNPWRGDDKTPGCGFNPADVVCMQPSRFGLSQGQKLLYERLVRFAGRDGQCYPSQETLAQLLGVTDRQVRADLKRLQESGLIDRRKRVDRRSDTCIFLWHEIFEAGPNPASDATADLTLTGSRLPGDRKQTTGQAEDLSGSTLPVNGEFDRKQASAHPEEYVTLTGSRLPPNTVQEKKAHSSGVVDGSRAGLPRTRQASAPRENPFEDFQHRYPEPKRGVKVESACRAYVGRIHGTPGEHEKLIAGLSRYLTSTTWQRALADDPAGRFIPTMERFIADGLYLDHPAPADEASDEYRRAPSPKTHKWDPIAEDFLPVEAAR